MNEQQEWQELGQQLRVDALRAAAATGGAKLIVMKRLAACALVAGFIVAATGCGGSGKGSGSAPVHALRSLASSPSTSSSAVDAVVRAYWHDITTGHFRAAFAKFDRAEQKRSHGQHWFVADKKRDAPIKAQLKLGTTSVNGPLATVPIVELRTVGSLTGCHLWTGNYRLRHIGSHWLIDAANLTKHSC
jgi:hypothetical protein